jgi:hypothetical protein
MYAGIRRLKGTELRMKFEFWGLWKYLLLIEHIVKEYNLLDLAGVFTELYQKWMALLCTSWPHSSSNML